MSDFEKVIRVIRSCKTHAQNNIAYEMAKLYERKHGSSVDILYALLDENLIDIMTKEC